MKILKIIFFISCLLTANIAPAETIQNPNREVRAGIFNFDGYHSKDDNDNLTGYGIDLLNLLSEYSHLNFKHAGYENSWQDMIEMLKNGEIDVVSSARRSPEREEVFAFSLPVGRNHTTLSKQVQNTKLRAGDYSTYNGIKIGAVAGSSQNNHLPDFAKDKKFSYTLIEYESPEKLANALQSGEVDAILSSNLRKPENETILDIIKSDNFYMIARKEDQAIINEINNAIEQMNLNEGDWQNDIYYRHYGPDISAAPEFSQNEQDYIGSLLNSSRKITATGRGDIPPYSYVENGQLKGILPDYFSRIMEATGLPFELVVSETPADYQDKVKNRKVDIVLDMIGSGDIVDNAVPSGFVTDPYMVTGVARVTRADFRGPVKTIAVSKTAPVSYEESMEKDASVIRKPTAAEALAAVQNGEADVAYVLPFSAQTYVNRVPGNGLIYTMIDNTGAKFKMFVPSSTDHELITILKKAMRGLPAGTLNQLGSSYLSVAASQMTLSQYLRANPEVLVTGATAIMLAASLLFFMWLRGRWNRRILAATENANQELSNQLAIVEALSRDYTNVLAINSDNGITGIIKISDHGVVDESSSRGEKKIYGHIIAHYLKSHVHPEDRDDLARALSLTEVKKELKEKEEYTGTYRIIENGEDKYYQFTFVRPSEDSASEENLILAGFRNIDDVIRKEQRQKQELAEALAKSRYASAAKTAFLNNMSHDIRTPMNAIIGFTNLAAANVKNAPMVKRYLGKIMTSGNHLLSLINDVLDMSRIESGKVKIEEKQTHLPEILHDLRTIAQADVKAKQLDFQISTTNVHNETIFCDRLRLNQVLLNILSNAIKYTPAGGKVSINVTQLDSTDNNYATFIFTISDSGIGMSEEFQEHVFEPFERESTSTVSGIQGTGLGLAITKKIVDIMHGDIKVRSKPNEGSTFIATFQFKIRSDNEKTAILPQFVNARALVVDDDIETCTSIAKMLSELGLRPDWTTLGKEALVRTQFAMDQNDPYAIFFLDLMMADMNGMELARRLRKTVPANVPIIIFTAYDWTDIEEEGKEAGVTAFGSKPVFLSALREILTKPVQTHKDELPAQTASDLFMGKRILLAEDNEMNQEIAQMILENAGFKLDIVENGQEAVDKVQAMPEDAYALILMDVQMPVMNGYAATRAIRNLDNSARANIPIIAMTANAFEEDREEAIKSGMNGYVAKPVDVKKLMDTLEEIIKKQK